MEVALNLTFYQTAALMNITWAELTRLISCSMVSFYVIEGKYYFKALEVDGLNSLSYSRGSIEGVRPIG